MAGGGSSGKDSSTGGGDPAFLLPRTKASEGTVAWVNSRQLKEGWSLATQIKMFSDAVDSIQETFVEALSQSRFSTGGRISKQK